MGRVAGDRQPKTCAVCRELTVRDGFHRSAPLTVKDGRADDAANHRQC
jgi:hypothetical protein